MIFFIRNSVPIISPKAMGRAIKAFGTNPAMRYATKLTPATVIA